MHSTDVLILGDGIVAKTLALALNEIGLASIRIAPPNPQYPNDPRSYAVTNGNRDWMRALGAEPAAISVNQIALQFGESFGDQPAIIETDGALMHMIDHSDINLALDGELGNKAIDKPTNNITEDDQWIGLPNSGIRGRVLVVAEGRRTASARQLGFGFRTRDFHQKAIVTKLRVTQPHDNVARQLFTRTGPIGILPASDGMLSIVWSQDAARADALMALDETAFLSVLGDHIGNVVGGMELAIARSAFALADVHATRLISGRALLIGDAAHVVHPMAGQGLNLGLRDVTTLVDVLRNAKNLGQDIGNPMALAQYASRRKPDIERLSLLTRALYTSKGLPLGNVMDAILPKITNSQRIRDLVLAQIDPR